MPDTKSLPDTTSWVGTVDGATWTVDGTGALVSVPNFHGGHITVELGFGFGALETPTWTDVTSYVRAIDWERGRQFELDRIEAGIGSITFDNRDGDFNPINTAGAFYPDLKPSVPVRITATYATVDYRQFYGLIEDVPVDFNDTDSTVTIPIVDPGKILALARTTRRFDQVAAELTPRAHWRFSSDDDTADSGPEGDHDITWTGTPATVTDAAWYADEAVDIPTNATYGQPADGASDLDLIGALTFVAWVKGVTGHTGYLFSRYDNALEAPYYWFVSMTFLSLGWVDDDAGVVAAGSTGGESFDMADDEWHCVAVTRSADCKTVRHYVDGELVRTNNIGAATGAASATNDSKIARFDSVPSQTFNHELSELVVYESELSARQIKELAVAKAEGLPVERTDERIRALLEWAGFTRYDLETGQTTMAASTPDAGLSVLDEIGKATDTEAGYLFHGPDGRVKFHDRHYRISATILAEAGAFGATDLTFHELGEAGTFDSLIYNEVIVTPGDQADPATAIDATSVTDHGIRTLERTTYPNDEEEAVDMAAWLLGRYSEPGFRVGRITFKLGKDTALWPIILGAEIGNRYRLRKSAGGDDIDVDVYLEHIAHRASRKQWTVTWQLSPAAQEAFWVLEDSELSQLDSTTVLNY